jgi:dienelactone hydrolase
LGGIAISGDDAVMNQGPHELPFVLDVPAEGVVTERLGGFDLTRPAGASGPPPVVVLVHGPVPAQAVRPRDWPVYQGYSRLAAGRGLAGAALDLDYPSPMAWAAAAGALEAAVQEIRERPEVDGDRVAVWGFSGGGLLVGRWLAYPPAWLRCLALSYPMVPPPSSPGSVAPHPNLPIVLTRVGRERPVLQATVDTFLATAAEAGASVHCIDVPNGQHAFDMLDHEPRSREAVTEAMDAVQRHLTSDRRD